MNKRQYMRKNSSESGVALVFALAMLALLLIMLVGFLGSAILEQRIAYNQSGQSITRTVARSAIKQAANVLAVYEDDAVDEVIAFTGYADDNGGSLNADTVRRMTPVSSYNINTDITNMDNADADNRVKKLLQLQGINPDNYMWDKDNKPQWVPMVVEVPTDNAHKHITGRYAYAIIPNLGIEPTLLNREEEPKRIGGQYSELPFSGLELTSTNWQYIFNQDKWMSLDVLGSRYVLGRNNSPWTTHLGSSDKAREDFKKKDETTFMEVVNTFFTTSQNRLNQYDADRIDLAEVGTQANADKIADLITTDAKLKQQIAANIVDYVDTDNKPTSDVAPQNWLTQTPTYTGNEKTPYINQIVSGFELKGTYTVKTQSLSGLSGLVNQQVTRTVKFTPRGRFYVELINIYPQDLSNVSKVVLKNVKLSLSGEIRFGTAIGNNFIPATSNGSKAVNKVTLSKATVELTSNGAASVTVSKNGYAVVSGDVTFDGSLPSVTDTRNMLRSATPAADVNLKISEIEFERAVLLDKDNNGVDFVKGTALAGGEQNFIGSVQQNILQSDKSNAWLFNSNNQTFTSSAYASFEIKDPRCNLDPASCSNWSDSDFSREKTALRTAEDASLKSQFTLGIVNKDASEVKYEDVAGERDWEFEEDPAKISTGYIRNDAMQSVWELGFIHRGEPWKTINLKAADHTREKTYFNDAVLLDEIYFCDPTLTDASKRDAEKSKKYNINYPYSHLAAFGPLTKNLKYCPTTENIISDDGKLYPEEGTVLNDNQWQDLRKWIAYKCYKSDNGNPSKFDGAKNYHFYRHRGYLANVITDWALNCPSSPYFGKGKMDAYLEELISKIAPLTRAGEPYEYFTVFAVAQSIKDVGGLTGSKKISRYDRTGALQEENCQQGKWDPGFDEVTGEVYMIARVRRELVCNDSDSCLDGKHTSDCKYTVRIIESYALNEQ